MPQRLLIVVTPATDAVIHHTVVLRSDTEQDWDVSSVAPDAAWLSAELRPRAEDGPIALLDVRIDATLIAGNRNGPHRSLLVIQTSGNATGEVTCPSKRPSAQTDARWVYRLGSACVTRVTYDSPAR